MFHYFWPSLLTINFVKCLVTPIIKTFKKGIKTNDFYTTIDFDEWSKTNDVNKFKIKYYKGLGTSTDKDAKEYF